MYPDAEVAAALSERYLRQTALSAIDALGRLHANERLRRAAATGCLREAMSVAEKVCQDDFRCRRIHCIDGWVLAQTELDIAALFTMRRPIR
jgi:hypothetical protein